MIYILSYTLIKEEVISVIIYKVSKHMAHFLIIIVIIELNFSLIFKNFEKKKNKKKCEKR